MPIRPPASRWSPVAPAAAALAVLLLAGCGQEEAPGGRAKARPLAIEVTESSGHRFRYTAPRSVPAGLVELRLKNAGRLPHKAQLFRIEGRHTVAEALRASGKRPPWLYAAGGVGTTEPGASSSVIQQLHPGSYYIGGAGSERGKVAPLKVVGESSEVELPKARASVTANEYSFAATGLKPGRNSVELVNVGIEPHHLVVARIRAGSTAADVRRAFQGQGPGPPPVDIRRAQETAVLEEGQRQVVELELKRGPYALLCFVPDRAGGPPHVRRGMIDAATVR